MPIYKIKLKDRKIVVKDTMAFFFTKPSGFTFKPGQQGDFTITNPQETDNEGNVREFQIASQPSSDQIMVATRLRDTAFKHSIQEMPLDSEFILDSTYGSFTLHHNQEPPAVIIA